MHTRNKLFVLHLLIPIFAWAQITQIGADIDGEAAGDNSGTSISLSADGTIMAIGAPYNDGINGSNSGHVRVYQNTAGAWTQIGADIDGGGISDWLGQSVSISADGSIVAIGAPSEGDIGLPGYVRIYQNTGGAWTQIGEDIIGEATGDNSGGFISLSDDGNIVAIGAVTNNGNGNNSGHVRVYQIIGGTWTQIGEDIDGESEGDISGTVSLSGDGSIVAIGAWFNDGNGNESGHVRIYQNTSGTWTQIGEDIDGERNGDHSGSSTSLNNDGSIVAIGARFNDGINGNSSGHVRIYQNTGGVWTKIGADIDGEAEIDHSGFAVRLNSDGRIVAIGAILNDGNGTSSGHVRIYQNIGGTWTKIGADIDGEAEQNWFGWSVSLSADGSIVAIGSRLNDGNGSDSGHVRVFDLSSVMAIDDKLFLDFSVYPTPTTGILHINSEAIINQVVIYNLIGQKILEQPNIDNSIDVSALSNGLYILECYSNRGKHIQKFIKK